MKPVRLVLGALLACSASAAFAAATDAPEVERWRSAMQSARWTGPMLASTAETLPKGHFYTEPYFYDVISGGKHHPGSSGFYQYGLLDNLTVGVQPTFAIGTEKPNREFSIGDPKLLSQVRLTHFTPEHRIPTVALVLNATVPLVKHDRLRPTKQGHGSGAFVPEIGVNVQQYFMLGNGRLLRARINVLHTLPFRTDVVGRSVYGTAVNFRGRARPSSKTTLIGAVEYSLTREWVLAFDVIRDTTNGGWLEGRVGAGPLTRTKFAKSRSLGFAPAVEYNWSDTSGALLGLWISPKGHNSPRSVTPAIAIQRFW